MTKGKRRGGGGFRGSVAPARGGQLPGQSGREDRISKRVTISILFLVRLTIDLFVVARSTAAIALAKARADAQRARVALTHASGKFVAPPPSRSKPRTEENQLFKNPYLPSASQNQTAATRVSSSSSGPSRSSVIGRHTVTSPPSSPLPGSYPSRDSAQNRAALPPHLERPSLPLVAPSSPARFRLSDGRPKSKEIHRPAVQNFEPPKPAVPAGMDFFGDRSRAAPKGLLESLHRSHDESRTGEKRKSHEEEMPKKKQQSMDNARPVSVTQPVPAVPLVRQPLTTGGSMSADEHARLSSLLFRKRAKPRPGAGRVGA